MKSHPHSLELLEARIAPSTLHFVNPTTATYTDVDGDTVTVKFTKGILSQNNLPNVLVTVPSGVGDQLQTIDLAAAGLAAPAAGTGITVTAALAAGGDGLVNVGYIKGTGLDLGAITIHGDLGEVQAGDAVSKTMGLLSLTVHSLGVQGTATGAPSLESDILGPLGVLKVAGDVKDAFLLVTGATNADYAYGKIGLVSIGGSLIGGAGTESGVIHSSNSLGPVSIGQDLVGGTGNEAGLIESDSGNVPSITIGGSIIGSSTAVGTHVNGGRLAIIGNLGMLKIAHHLQGGAPGGSASVFVNGTLGGVRIGGSIIGGTGAGSGGISTAVGGMGLVSIGGDLRGGDGANSGLIESGGGKLAGVVIAGSLLGGSASDTGQILVDQHFDLGPVFIGRQMKGAGGDRSGVISAGGTVTTVTVGGSLIGGSATDSGGVFSSKAVGPVKIGGDLEGGSVAQSGLIFADDGGIGGTIGAVSISGSLVGGGGVLSGAISCRGAAGAVTVGLNIAGGTLGALSFTAVTVGGSLLDLATISTTFGGIGPVKIGHDIVSTATISSGASLKSLTVGGSMAGSVSASPIGVVKIGADINGGSLAANGKIDSVTVGGSLIGGGISAGSLGVAFIGQDVIGGSDASGNGTGNIQCSGTLGTLTIGGSVIGGSYAGTGNFFTSGHIFVGSANLISIAGDLVGGDVTGTGSLDGSGDIQAGHVGKMVIGGSLKPGVDGSTGALTHDGSINSSQDIGSLTINGGLLGRPDTGNGASPAIISAKGQAIQGRTTDLAIGKLTILGQVEYASIVAGYDRTLAPVNGDAQIGAVFVGGNWTASNLVAGAMNSASSNASFGDANDASIGAGSSNIVASIASVVIAGRVTGVSGGTAHFGFVAEHIGSFSAGGTVYPLTAGAHNDTRAIGATSDVNIHEV